MCSPDGSGSPSCRMADGYNAQQEMSAQISFNRNAAWCLLSGADFFYRNMRKIYVLALLIPFGMQAQLKDLVDKARGKVEMVTGGDEVGSGLKQALKQGVDKQVTKLTARDGFYRNELVKIAFPEELRRVEQSLRRVGLSKLADQGVAAMNHAAEEAVKEATPIFTDAIVGMSFTDARNILMGNDRAATTYLEGETSKQLYQKFLPVVKRNFEKVGADKIWSSIITKYNSMPLVSKVNPDMNDYVTDKALQGVFTMIAVEEKQIRTDVSARTSPLLRKVFAMQD